MAERKKRTLTAVGALFLVCVLVVGMAFSLPPLRSALVGFATPLMKTTARIHQITQSALGNLLPSGRSRVDRLEDYRKKIERLEVQLASAKRARRENRRLRKQLQLSARPEWNITHARVVARDPLSWNIRFRIDRGSAQGVRKGDCVLVDGTYVAGIIKETTARTATVATVAAPSCRVSVRIRGTHGFGIMRGSRQTRWYSPVYSVVEYLPPDVSYEKSKLVETSGLSLQIPGGLPVGRLTPWDDSKGEISRTVNTLYKETKLTPTADLQDIQFVAVVSKERTEALKKAMRE